MDEVDNKSYTEKLIRALHHPEPETPIRAAHILGLMMCREAVSELITVMRSSTDAFITTACIEALSRIGDIRALGVIREMTRDDHPLIVRKAAMRAITNLERSNT